MAEETSLSVEEREKQLLGWLRLEFAQGLAALKKEPAWDKLPRAISYLEGKQEPGKGKALSKITDNRLRKIALETAALMTDVRPIWNYETQMEEVKAQGEVLNKLARAWWRNSRADKKLVSILLYALCGGTGYGLLTFDSLGGRPLSKSW